MCCAVHVITGLPGQILYGHLRAPVPQDRLRIAARDGRHRRAPRAGSDHCHSRRHCEPTLLTLLLVAINGKGVGPVAVLVPVKAFATAKLRLAPAMAAGERAALARTMADRVVAAASPLPVAVVCDDDEVAAWARERGAIVIHEPGRGLNGAVQEGVSWLAGEGARQV